MTAAHVALVAEKNGTAVVAGVGFSFGWVGVGCGWVGVGCGWVGVGCGFGVGFGHGGCEPRRGPLIPPGIV